MSPCSVESRACSARATRFANANGSSPRNMTARRGSVAALVRVRPLERVRVVLHVALVHLARPPRARPHALKIPRAGRNLNTPSSAPTRCHSSHVRGSTSRSSKKRSGMRASGPNASVSTPRVTPSAPSSMVMSWCEKSRFRRSTSTLSGTCTDAATLGSVACRGNRSAVGSCGKCCPLVLRRRAVIRPVAPARHGGLRR